MSDTVRTGRPAAYRQRHLLGVVVFTVLVAVAAPALATSRSDQFLINLWLVYSVSAIGFYWVFGLAGRFAFCQTFMMALGGYFSAWLTREETGAPFLVGVLGAAAVTGLLAGAVGLLVRKAQHFYFAIATFAVTQIGMVVFQEADGFTGPSGQTVGIGPPELFGHELLRDDEIFWLFLGVVSASLALAALIERSPLRRETIAARDNGVVAELAGIAVTRVQLVLFMLGSAMGGLSGALIGHWHGVIATDSFSIDLAIGIFLMVLLGGIDSIWGPVIGAAVYVALPQLLSGIEQYGSIVYGLLLLIVVLALPNGVAGSVRQLTQAVRGRLAAGRSREESADAAH